MVGKSNSGKTQLAMQAVLSAARTGSKSLFIDTEGTFRPERMVEIAKERGWDVDGLLERIVYLRADSLSEQMAVVANMNTRETTAPCRAVVIDTVTRNFSLELPGNANMAGRQGSINVHLSEMSRDAFLYGRTYGLMNRVTFVATGDVGIGGRTVEQLVHASVRLAREKETVRVTLMGTGETAVAEIGPAGVD